MASSKDAAAGSTAAPSYTANEQGGLKLTPNKSWYDHVVLEANPEWIDVGDDPITPETAGKASSSAKEPEATDHWAMGTRITASQANDI